MSLFSLWGSYYVYVGPICSIFHVPESLPIFSLPFSLCCFLRNYCTSTTSILILLAIYLLAIDLPFHTFIDGVLRLCEGSLMWLSPRLPTGISPDSSLFLGLCFFLLCSRHFLHNPFTIKVFYPHSAWGSHLAICPTYECSLKEFPNFSCESLCTGVLMWEPYTL